MPPGPDHKAATSQDNAKKTDDKPEKKAEKSYLASAVDSINPWTSVRSTTPTPKDPNPLAPGKADDHAVNSLYGLSFKKYPEDCPPLRVQWFHASDVPKRKPVFLKPKKPEPEKPKPPEPKKFVSFSKNDSRSIENAYQKLLEELENDRNNGVARKHVRNRSAAGHTQPLSNEEALNQDAGRNDARTSVGLRVPVNEDFLFDVDIEQRELSPVYWLGPVYSVLRGTWFYQEGSFLRPCEENLAAQLEEGYLKTKPWTYPAIRNRSNSAAKDVTPKASIENLKTAGKSQNDGSLKVPPAASAAAHQPQTYRLFGTYMNSVVTFQDSNTAWLSYDSVFSRMTATVYERLAGSGFMNGVKLVRGYSEPKSKEPTTPVTATQPPDGGLDDNKQDKVLKRRSAPPASRADIKESGMVDEDGTQEMERMSNKRKREFPSYIETSGDASKQEEQIREREEIEIQEDYNALDGETQGREIEHLVLVTHGIGQLLSIRMESVNFVHDVNTLRKTFKKVYAESADLKALNSDNGDGPGNSKIQVLPVCWRHLLDFPKKRERKGETDLGDMREDEDEYPSLEDITIEGMAFARSLISDLALDVLLYQSGYRQQITEIVREESNRIYKLFVERNPGFKGKVHLVGHSLGSAILFDILCRQKEPSKEAAGLRNPLSVWPTEKADRPKDPHDLSFDFDVEDFYCLGSPIGLFQMLKGRTIAARHQANAAPSESPLSSQYADDPFLSLDVPGERVSTVTGLPFSVSSPKVAQLFNIFHPSDPISYRLEPLISTAMSSLKPQALPYTKKGIFGAVAPQGLSGIGAKVGQSVSGMWASLSAGIASSLLNQSLGISSKDMAKMNASTASIDSGKSPQAAGADGGSTDPASQAASNAAAQSERADARKKEIARQNFSRANSMDPGAPGSNAPNDSTLIDDDLETLYAKFQKKRVEEVKDSVSRAEEGQELGVAWAAEELKAQKLRKEELKVRALNWNGRVDYNIQESALDFNPLTTLASHLGYWQDEDVSHFLCSQLLCNREARGRLYGAKR